MDSVFLFWVAGNYAGLHKTMPASKESRGSRWSWMREGAEISASPREVTQNWGDPGNFSDKFRRETRLIFIPVLEESEPAQNWAGCGQKCLSLKGCLDSGRPHAPNQCRSFDKEKAKFPKWLLRYAHNRADLWRPAQNWADVYSRFGRKGTGWKVSRLPNDSKTCGKYFPHLKTFDGPDEQQDQTTTRSTENPAEFTTWE